jgi:DNA-binding response OmpR family regulator
MDTSPVVLVVSADRHLRRLLAASLDQIGCVSLDAATSLEALEWFDTGRVDVVIVDSSLNDPSQAFLVERLRTERPQPKVLYLIGRTDSAASGLTATGIDGYLRKPFRLHGLRDLVSSWLYDDAIGSVTSPGLSLN